MKYTRRVKRLSCCSTEYYSGYLNHSECMLVPDPQSTLQGLALHCLELHGKCTVYVFLTANKFNCSARKQGDRQHYIYQRSTECPSHIPQMVRGVNGWMWRWQQGLQHMVPTCSLDTLALPSGAILDSVSCSRILQHTAWRSKRSNHQSSNK